MTTLILYPAITDEPSASPFCVKVQCMLTFAGIDYAVRETVDPRSAPKGKLPALETETDVVADSDQIRDYIEQTYGVDFDEGLSETQRAVSRCVIRMVEEHIYFSNLYDEWGDDANWPHTRRAFFSDIPFPINGLVTRSIRKQVIAALNGQGMGRHSDEERLERIKKDVLAIRALVGDQAFLFGDKPTAADFSVVPMLRHLLVAPVETVTSAFVRNETDLLDYLDRGRDRFYPQSDKAPLADRVDPNTEVETSLHAV